MSAKFTMEDVLTKERPKREKRVKPQKEPKVPRTKKLSKRYGAFLRLYGPVTARTHAKLVLAHEPEPDTPEGFQAELEKESKMNYFALQQGLILEFNLTTSYRRR